MRRRWFGQGQGQGSGGSRGGQGGPQSAGPGGYCVCPDCGHKVKHVAGQPCFEKKCPKCGANMIRE